MSAATAPPAADATHPALPRALGLRDMVLFNIVAVVSLRWFATAAAAGPSSITLWVLAASAVLRAAGPRGERPGGPLSRRGRHLRLDQARLRRGARFPVRLVLLGQQHPVLSQPADVHRGGGDLRHRTRADRPGGAAGRTCCRPRSWRSGWRCGSTSWACAPGAGCRTSARWAPTSPASCSSASAPTPRFTRPSATPIDAATPRARTSASCPSSTSGPRSRSPSPGSSCAR